MKVDGFIDFIGESQQVTDNFLKREIWIKQGGEYPQTLNIQFTQDRADLLDSFVVGEPVSIDVNLRGRTWENPQTGEIKCFNTVEGWRITKLQIKAPDLPPKPEIIPEQENDDDLPF